MSFVDALNVRGEVQAVPAHFLTDFPDQFKPVTPEPAPKPTTLPAKAATSKES
jgi:hypothetical protein